MSFQPRPQRKEPGELLRAPATSLLTSRFYLAETRFLRAPASPRIDTSPGKLVRDGQSREGAHEPMPGNAVKLTSE